MRPGISIILSPADRRRLEALVGDRNVAQKHVWRARIVLHSADGIGTNGIMRRTGKSKACVWRWQERGRGQGVEIGEQRRRLLPWLQRVEPLQAARHQPLVQDRQVVHLRDRHMNRRRAVFTRASTLPLSLPLPGWPKRSRNR